MDLFTYLGAKNGKFTLPHKSDLFSYLLGKNSKLPIQTASGTTLEITAKKTNVLELTLDKMCSQDGTPTPDNPIEVNVAEGYRNLFSGDYSQFDNTGGTGSIYSYFKLPDDTKQYTLVMIAKNDFTADSNTYLGFTSQGGSGGSPINWVIGGSASGTIAKGTTLYGTSTDELRYVSMYFKGATTLQKFVDNFYIMLVEGTYSESTLLPYVPYGSNYINLNITDGVNSINKQIPLNDNFIGGIGDYKDVLTIDESGSISLVKNIGKVVLDGSESWTFASSSAIKFRLLISNAINFIDDQKNAPLVFTNRYQPFAWNRASSYTNGVTTNTGQLKYLCFKNGDITTLEAWQTELATNNIIVYYPLETPTTTPLGNIDISLFKGSNIITNSDNCNMTIKYY